MNEELVTTDALSDSALQAKIDLKASPERVYAAWTKPEQFQKWFGPRAGGSLEVAQFDCSVGGVYDVTMVFSDGDRVKIFGQYLELNPVTRIVFTWQWMEGATKSGETLVTVILAPSDKGTHLTLTHERFPTSDSRNDHQQGWAPLLTRLDAALTSE